MELKFYERQEVIAKCEKDHSNGKARIIKIDKGYGRHIHSNACGYEEGDRLSCMRDCDDSDLIIELAYKCMNPDKFCIQGNTEHEHHAVYGFLDGEFSLWAD